MKITFENLQPGDEEEIIIRAKHISESIMKSIYDIMSQMERLTAFKDGSITLLSPNLIYYFESVDNITFAYCEKEVYEVREKLYELEKKYGGMDFIRASKSTIINLSKVRKFVPSLNGRFEAIMKNDEKTLISRQYVSELKKRLGL